MTALTLALGSGDQSSGSGSTEQGAATALSLPGGQLGLTIVGALLILTGLLQLMKAARPISSAILINKRRVKHG